MAKGDKLGPRCIVQVGKGKNGKAVYSYMLEKTAKHFGLPIEKKIPSRKGKSGRIISIRGSQAGSSSITVPLGDRFKTPKGTLKTARMPMPPGMDIPKIQTFLKRATKNKPKTFTTSDGVSYPVSQ